MTVKEHIGQISRRPKIALRFVLISMVLFFSVPAIAQQWAFELWHEGKIVLTDGDTLKGMLKYDLQQDVVHFTANDQNDIVYSARKVLYFEIYDNTVHLYRQ